MYPEQRIKAFSLLEVLVVLLLTGLLFSLAFTMYLQTTRLHATFLGKKEDIQESILAFDELGRLFMYANRIQEPRKDALLFELGSEKIALFFNPEHIVRKVSSGKLDTLLVQGELLEVNYYKSSRLVTDATININGQEFFFSKAYDAKTLLNN